MPGPTIELVLYAARPGNTEEALLEAVEASNRVLRDSPGYLSREPGHSTETGLWMDLVHWADRASALAAAAAFGAHPDAQRLLEAIDFQRLTMHHFDSRLVDEALTLVFR